MTGAPPAWGRIGGGGGTSGTGSLITGGAAAIRGYSLSASRTAIGIPGGGDHSASASRDRPSLNRPRLSDKRHIRDNQNTPSPGNANLQGRGDSNPKCYGRRQETGSGNRYRQFSADDSAMASPEAAARKRNSLTAAARHSARNSCSSSTTTAGGTRDRRQSRQSPRPPRAERISRRDNTFAASQRAHNALQTAPTAPPAPAAPRPRRGARYTPR